MKANIFKTGILALVLLACQTAGKKEATDTVDSTKKNKAPILILQVVPNPQIVYCLIS
jgi:hypothetical protein